ncbi:LPXTG cell wall anchor domain-containing protein [Streptomyces iconiensis]|uniref:LPXTG cell wall anchor domain-containing protein n=1 Tax=Streptomyces iconiensis TaxID=1384038 RepID=A0ABT6ZY62_9ACTN|nr:LPXTG cell wall anchor domain-containing protein [Streptomyces iconiensis]MDJ1134013.1 LPXTG cell wall anchor domain-containing protein [Streptomyces iconiensis]
MSGAGLSTLSAHRRPLATAAAAGGLLFALWFVPSAHADPEEDPGGTGTSAPGVSQHENAAERGTHAQLAETGSFDSTPFVVGGLGFVGIGGAVLVQGQRRARTQPRTQT